MSGKFVKTVAKATLPEATRRWLRERQRHSAIVYSRAIRKLAGRRMVFRNREGLRNFDFVLYENRERAGVSALLRVKNEEKKLCHCLESILNLFDEVVLVDNGSEDNSLEVARKFKRQKDITDKVRLHFYPFKIARCGSENRHTPEDSVHSLSYFYNWSLSRCSFRYVCKWDGDMIARKNAREAFQRLLHQAQNEEMCWELPGQTVYRDLRGTYYRARGEVNQEIMLFPYGFNPRFCKIDHYEALTARPPLPVAAFGDVVFYELKFADEDEFSHWSTTDFPTSRKRREWDNFKMIKSGIFPHSRFEALRSDFLLDEVGSFEDTDSSSACAGRIPSVEPEPQILTPQQYA